MGKCLSGKLGCYDDAWAFLLVSIVFYIAYLLALPFPYFSLTITIYYLLLVKLIELENAPFQVIVVSLAVPVAVAVLRITHGVIKFTLMYVILLFSYYFC